MRKEEIVKLLEKSGLQKYMDAIESWIYPSQQILLKPEQDDNIPIGTSKIGGNPDLPDDLEWPKWKHYNQSFIAQLNLAELPSMTSLPSSGLLSFFYAVEPMDDDEDFYDDPNTCRIFYTSVEQLHGLSRRTPPSELAEDAILNPNRIEFRSELCVPPSESALLESIGLDWDGNREDFDKYWDVFLKQFREQSSSTGSINRLLGHPDQIQGDMQMSAEMLVQGLTWDSMKDPDARQRALKSALGWRLLLQIDSEQEKTGMMWGDVGRIYFWIREDDLLAMRFDNVYCEMQCH